MKKVFALVLVLITVASLAFSVSYKNNTYQKLAEEYTVKAQKALDAGEYDLAEEYAKKAEENANLSDAFIKYMMSKSDADHNMTLAKNRIEYVKSIHGDLNFPIAYQAAEGFYNKADEAYKMEDFDTASSNARQVIDVLSEVYAITPLPKYYVVRPWADTKDCFWNISGRTYVYSNPFLWENLYEANKQSLPQPDNPNLILPGMIMEIPSISGEYRDGTYSPDETYPTYSFNR